MALLIVLLSPNATEAASSKLSAEIHLKMKSSHGEERNVVISGSAKDGFSFNGVKLPFENLLLNRQAFAYLLHSEHVYRTVASCDAGHFVLLRKVKGKRYQESGCINSKRFQNLYKATRMFLSVRARELLFKDVN